MFFAVVVVVAIACSGGDSDRSTDTSDAHFNTIADDSRPQAFPVSPEIESSAFSDGESIPSRHTCEGEDVSPGLSWSASTTSARSVALLVDDPDAPRGTFTHWIVFDMPPDTTGLTENATVGTAAIVGRNSFGGRTYRGPCPPSGSPHRYRFTLYYLDFLLADSEGLTGDSGGGEFLTAIEGHVQAQARFTGLFGR